MKQAEIMVAKFDSKKAEYRFVEAVKSAYLNMSKAKLRFAYQCAKLRAVNKDSSVYGMKYSEFMAKYFGMTKASASEYASAGTMVVYEKNTYHSKFVSLDACKYGDFTVSALLIASKNENAFKDAFEHDCFTVFSSVSAIKKALKSAEQAEAEQAEAEAEAEQAEQAEAEQAEQAEAEAEQSKTVAYNAYDVLCYQTAIRALETACSNNDAALEALADLKAAVRALTGID